MKLLAGFKAKISDFFPKIIQFFGAGILASFLTGLITSSWALALASAVVNTALVTVFSGLAFMLERKQELEQDREESIRHKLDKIMDEDDRRYKTLVRERKLQAGRVEQFECENLGYNNGLGGYLMRRTPDGSVILVRGRPNYPIALGEKVVVSQPSGQHLAVFSRE